MNDTSRRLTPFHYDDYDYNNNDSDPFLGKTNIGSVSKKRNLLRLVADEKDDEQPQTARRKQARWSKHEPEKRSDGTTQTEEESLENVPPSKTGVSDFNELDVLSGRGGIFNHAGNHYFRKIADQHRLEYIQATRSYYKSDVAKRLVHAVRKRGGRFLKKNKDDGKWYEVGDEIAYEKAAQMLRNHAPRIRKQLEKEKKEEDTANSSRKRLEHEKKMMATTSKRRLEKEKEMMAATRRKRNPTGAGGTHSQGQSLMTDSSLVHLRGEVESSPEDPTPPTDNNLTQLRPKVGGARTHSQGQRQIDSSLVQNLVLRGEGGQSSPPTDHALPPTNNNLAPFRPQARGGGAHSQGQSLPTDPSLVRNLVLRGEGQSSSPQNPPPPTENNLAPFRPQARGGGTHSHGQSLPTDSSLVRNLVLRGEGQSSTPQNPPPPTENNLAQFRPPLDGTDILQSVPGYRKGYLGPGYYTMEMSRFDDIIWDMPTSLL